jgi:hypothetical protein
MNDALEDFRRTVEETAARLRELDDAEAASRRATAAWSRKEILGHLIDSAANNHQRFVRAQFQEDLSFPGYAQEEWVAAQRYDEAPWPQLVELWRLYNLHLLHVVSRIPADTLRRPRHPHTLHKIAWRLVDEREPATLEYLILDYVGHLKHHLAQIERAGTDSPRGAQEHTPEGG